MRRVPALVVTVVLIGAACSDTAVEDDSVNGEPAETTTTTEAEVTTTTTTTTTTTPSVTTTVTTSTTTTSTTTSTTTTTMPVIAFGSGVYLVGTEITAGIYETVSSSVSFCYWERLSGLGGTFQEIITNDNASGRAIVEIKPSDVAFNSSGCGNWRVLTAFTQTLEEFGDGDWAVGLQISPGRYRSDGSGFCYWERQRGFSGELGDIIANNITEGSSLVDISSNDVGFKSSGCGTWRRIG